MCLKPLKLRNCRTSFVGLRWNLLVMVKPFMELKLFTFHPKNGIHCGAARPVRWGWGVEALTRTSRWGQLIQHWTHSSVHWFVGSNSGEGSFACFPKSWKISLTWFVILDSPKLDLPEHSGKPSWCWVDMLCTWLDGSSHRLEVALDTVF